jgi:DNA modification methylase
MRRPIQNNSKPGDYVYEPFAGSGTTIIAAEMMNRYALAIELAPNYVDVCVERWMTFSKGDAVLDCDGRTFAQIKAARQKIPSKKASGKPPVAPAKARARSPSTSPG